MTDSIDSMTDELATVAVKFGIDKQAAIDLASAILARFKNCYGGGYVYVPKPDKEERNRQIKAVFNGVNQNEVCAQFDISKSTLYRVTK